jgi:hypothetical protein
MKSYSLRNLIAAVVHVELNTQRFIKLRIIEIDEFHSCSIACG